MQGSELVKVLLSFSALFMVLGAMFYWHAYRTYDKAKELMQALTNMIWRNSKR